MKVYRVVLKRSDEITAEIELERWAWFAKRMSYGVKASDKFMRRGVLLTKNNNKVTRDFSVHRAAVC